MPFLRPSALVTLSWVALLSTSVFAADVLISRRVQTLHKRDAPQTTAASSYPSHRSIPHAFNISFYHINDVHARLPEFQASTGMKCTDPSLGCFGGYPRIKHIIDTTRGTHNHSLVLNAGDEFQGTMFYTLYKGWKIAETLNQIGIDAMTLGNHEWDDGDALLGQFVNNLTFPVICANVKSLNPILAKKIIPFKIFHELGIAVIGVTVDASSLSRPDNTTVFSDPIKTVQDTIDMIHSISDIRRIVALTHIGYEEDIKLAQNTTGLSLIIGGHSHTPLGNMTDHPEGPYPTIVNNTLGEEVFVVTAYRWGEDLGYIDLLYDHEDRVVAYHGAPFHIDNKTEQDPGLLGQIREWDKPINAFAKEEIGQTKVKLVEVPCSTQECLFGDLMADAMETYGRKKNPKTAFALFNAGNVRAGIDIGPITRDQTRTVFPFINSIVLLTRTGAQIRTTLEGIVSGTNQDNHKNVTSFLQISAGLRITYIATAAVGSRLKSVNITGAPLNDTQSYTFATLDYLANGGDNFFNKSLDVVTLDLQADVLEDYIKDKSPLDIKLDGRIQALNGTV